MPVRTADGDLVGRAVPYSASSPATAQMGDDVPGPIRTGDGELVGRTALYSVSGGVATPATIVDSANVGQPGGPAGPLDAQGEIPLSQIPIDGINYQGAWDASANSPTLTDGTGTAGDLYRVSTAGTQDLGSGSQTFAVGDHVIYEGAIWQQLDPAQVVAWGDITGTLANQTDLSDALDAKAAASDLTAHEADTGAGAHLPTGGTSGQVAVKGSGDAVAWQDQAPAPVQSVAGKTGAVTLAKGDVGLGNVDNTTDVAKPVSTAQQSALDGKVDTSDKATEAQAEAGTDNDTWMTPERTAQAITAQVHGGADGATVTVLGTSREFSNTSFTVLSDFSTVVSLDASQTQTHFIELELYISGGACQLRFNVSSNSDGVLYSGGAQGPDSSDNNVITYEYDQDSGGITYGLSSGSAIRKLSIWVYVDSDAFGGSYGDLACEVAQTNDTDPVTIFHWGSKMTARLLSSS